MACLEMYNNSHSHSHSHSKAPPPPPMSPRISFSNDFAESQHHSHNNFSRSESAPASTDFEFSVTDSNILTPTADELFSKGRLLPFKNNNQRTLRDELLVDDDDNHTNTIFSLKPPKSSSSSSSSSSNRWKGFLGLRKSHIGSKKPEKIDLAFDSAKRSSFPLQDPNHAKSPQEMVSNEVSSSSEMEMGI